jgi:hypothetical protein
LHHTLPAAHRPEILGAELASLALELSIWGAACDLAALLSERDVVRFEAGRSGADMRIGNFCFEHRTHWFQTLSGLRWGLMGFVSGKA